MKDQLITKLRTRCAKMGASLLATLASLGIATAATVTVTVVDDGVSNIGAPGTFYWAITNASAGDTIAFNIPGAGPHYLQVPPQGFPIIHRQSNLIIDGYTQPGSSRNTNPITSTNNAVIKIVIDGRTGGCRDMRYNLFGSTVISDPPINNTYMAAERPGLTGTGESAILGIYRSTNVNIRGLAILGKILTSASTYRQKGIVIEMDYDGVTANLPRFGYTSGSSDGCHINGCWLGVNPTNATVAGSADQAFRCTVTSYRHTDAATNAVQRPTLVLGSLTVGVKQGSANPRAEFNVMAGVGNFLSLDAFGLRVSGNFIGMLPDGTPFNFLQDSADPAQIRSPYLFDVGCRFSDELNRPMVIGTDGDGVNDADEGNFFGPLKPSTTATPYNSYWGFFNTDRNPFIIAGNRIGVGLDGTPFVNHSVKLGGFRMDQGTQVRFGSDFNGVSDALEANVIYNNNDFASLYPAPSTEVAPSFVNVMDNVANAQGWFSFRGNKMVNNFPIYNPNDTSARNYTNSWNTFFPDVDDKRPVLAASTITTLNGTFNAPSLAGGATNVVIDVYTPDPASLVNGAAFLYPFFTSGFVNGSNYLGSFLDNGPYDSNPAVGAFALDVSALNLAHGTQVTVAVTYSKWARPVITSVSHVGTSTTLTWTGDNGGPYTTVGAYQAGGVSSGFGVQSAASLAGPWTTTFAQGNSTTISAPGSAGFYRVLAPISGMTTLCAEPVTLP